MKQFEAQDILNFIKELPNDAACSGVISLCGIANIS
jgi:hypothetical protein